MRSLVPVLMLALALSGCVSDEEEPEDPLIAVCPQWVEGPYALEASAAVGDATEVTLAPERNGTLAAEFDGFPLDLYVLTVEASAPVTVQAATGDGRNLLLRDTSAPEPDSRPRLTVEGTAQVALYLTAVAHGTEADPSEAVLTLAPAEGTETAQVSITGTAWYRVCGAVGLPPQDR